MCANPAGPSNFDYLVLASIADSPRFLAMAGYRTAALTSMGPVRRLCPQSGLTASRH
jgi:hypothetical protein